MDLVGDGSFFNDNTVDSLGSAFANGGLGLGLGGCLLGLGRLSLEVSDVSCTRSNDEQRATDDVAAQVDHDFGSG